eukprot:504455_1
MSTKNSANSNKNRGTKRNNTCLSSTSDNDDNTKNPRPSKKQRRDKDKNNEILSKKIKNKGNVHVSKHSTGIYEKQMLQKHNSPSTESDVSDQSTESDQSDEFQEEYNAQKQQPNAIITNRNKKSYYVNQANANIIPNTHTNTNTNIYTQPTNILTGTITNQLQPTQHTSSYYNRQQTQLTNDIAVNKSYDVSTKTFQTSLIIVILTVVTLFVFIFKYNQTFGYFQSYLFYRLYWYCYDAQDEAILYVREGGLNGMYSVQVFCDSEDLRFMSYTLVEIEYEHKRPNSSFSLQKVEATNGDIFYKIINHYNVYSELIFKDYYICALGQPIKADNETFRVLHGCEPRENETSSKVILWKLHPTPDNRYELEAFIATNKSRSSHSPCYNKKNVGKWKKCWQISIEPIGWASVVIQAKRVDWSIYGFKFTKNKLTCIGVIHTKRLHSCIYGFTIKDIRV